MRLEHDLAIRREVRAILQDDVAIGVGDGWHRIVGRALVEIRDIADEAGVHVGLTHVENKRGSLVIRTDARAQRVPTAVADAIDEIRFNASDRSSMTCEQCGGLGFMIAGDEPRVRCGRCEATEVARQAIRREYREHIAEACRYYISTCLEHQRLFPVRNITMQVCLDDDDHRIFLDEVHERLCWWRAGSWIEGVDEALRDAFRRLDFDRVQERAEEWSVVRALFPEDFREADERNALIEDQRKRRAGEIRSAALAYVRACGRERRVLDIEAFGQRRWPRDSGVKRRIMIDLLRDEVRRGWEVVDVWQRFEVSGGLARRLVGAISYGDLYCILRAHEMPIAFRPGDIAAWVREGKMAPEEGMDILGIESEREFEAFLAAWLAREG